MFLNEVQVSLKLFLSLGHFGFVLVVFLELRDVLLESLIVGVIFLRCLKEGATRALRSMRNRRSPPVRRAMLLF